MHANYVQQPGCSSELSGVKTTEAQLIQIKITSAGLWSQDEFVSSMTDIPDMKSGSNKLDDTNMDEDGLTYAAVKSGARRGKLTPKFLKTDNELHEHQADGSVNSHSSDLIIDDVVKSDKEEPRSRFPLSARETFKAAVIHFGKKWYRRISFLWKHLTKILGSILKLSNIAGIPLDLDISKWLRLLHLEKVKLYAVQLLEKHSKTFEPTYLYTMEKGYFLLPDDAKSQHNIHTVNISISARHPCFGNRTTNVSVAVKKLLGMLWWQQLLINRFVGYDTILMNSLLSSPGQGYLYIFQSKEIYNLSYAQEPPEGPARFGDYLVTKCGVLMMSLFVFFTTTMSVSFTLRETQTRMLKFTVQLQHHARHRLPTFQLIFVHVIESLVFVPIMIGFSYLALSTTAAFMHHLILYFWNRFEVPALQRFMQNRRSQLQQHPDFQITSSTILASTLHITRLNTRNPGPANTDTATGPGLRAAPDQAAPANGAEPQFQGRTENDNPLHQMPGQGDPRQADNGDHSGTMSSFSSLLLWILGGASSESLNSFLSIFRDVRDQGQVYAESPPAEDQTNQDVR
ncbi:hypothetical protein G4B88_029228 [Cannabis sativa]|uniref:Uncharacterized protein n=1 Tax=Cannabis sativa TaxID=3483 RepID=A0A7J6E1L5_CANSA|nr:hypothetical protein G4B88_029228 [Cannabis sativa]